MTLHFFVLYEFRLYAQLPSIHLQHLVSTILAHPSYRVAMVTYLILLLIGGGGTCIGVTVRLVLYGYQS